MNNIFMGTEPFTIKNNIGSSRQIALKYGYKTYHGAPCVEGHTEKYTSSAHCVICRKERAKWYNPKNLEKIKTDPNHVVISKNLVHSGYSLTEEQIKENLLESNKKVKRRQLAKYKVNGKPMTEHDWLRMYEEQGGKCANPRCDFTHHNRWWEQGHNGFNVDHDHITEEAIGLLCSGCNMIEGWIENKANEVYGIIEYHKGKRELREKFIAENKEMP